MLSCEEVKINLHNYIDELLDKTLQKEIEIHLNTCDDCFERYNKIVGLLDKLNELPGLIDLHFSVRENISEALLNKAGGVKVVDTPQTKINLKKIKKEQLRLEKELIKSKESKHKPLIPRQKEAAPGSGKFIFLKEISFRKTVLSFIPVLLIVLGYFAYDLLKINSPWEVEWRFGKYSINGDKNANLKLSKYESLETKDSSQVILYVPQTGRIEMYSNSAVGLIKPKNGDNRVTFYSGQIKIITTAVIPYLTIEFKNYAVKDIGGVFTITKKKNNQYNVFVNFGMVDVLFKGKSYLIDEGYNCDLVNGKKPGTPYRFDATDSLKKYVAMFDENPGNENMVDKIITEAVASDALTLLSIIPKVQPIKRQILFQKISNYFTPPQEVTRMGVVALDYDMIELWWNDIEWRI